MSTLAITHRVSPQSRAVTSMARAGLIAQAIIYQILAWLTIQIAAGHRGPQANQKGALAEIISQPGGVAVAIVLVVGFASYSPTDGFGVRTVVRRRLCGSQRRIGLDA
jgi:hypothetical protein